ncbi:TIGR00730 family Rossman fold protein [Litoreibacter halocynthiae]|uniref:LOG family protein n=1 Tax=Litoreibacter halocynthiae TaxID=1242689 RepID=UPI0024918ED8|nr:TIGR00730 family Rossman fold protein [Litoreibacter halocynthiae]
MPQQKSVCVYCGSRFGANPDFKQAALDLGQALAANQWRLVYGAGDVGLMGAVAHSTQTAGGETFGVIPSHLFKREVGKRDLNTFIVTETMHERKKVMYMNSDAIVVMPGGAGSLDEFFEVLTWRQLGLHSKPIFLLNTNSFWSPLVALTDHIVAQGFADASLLDFISVTDTVTDLTRQLSDVLR